MFPILFEIGPFSLSNLWLLTCIGLLIGINYFLLITKRKRYQPKTIIKYYLSLFVFSIFGARLVDIIINWQIYSELTFWNQILNFFYIWDKELSLDGGLISFLLFFLIILIKEEEEIFKWTDILSQSILIIYFFYSIGSFFDGILYGKETTMPWGIILENPNVKYTIPIHPTQLYAAFYTLLIIIFIHKFQNKIEFLKKSGNTTFSSLFLYSFFKYIEFFFRGDDALLILNIRVDHIISFIVATISLIILLKLNNGFSFIKKKSSKLTFIKKIFNKS